MTGSKIIIGIDEAGRGPLIGDMVVSCVVLRNMDVAMLSEIGVRDSKTLSPKKRERIREIALRNLPLSFIAVYVTTRRVDSENLNTTTSETIKRLLHTVSKVLWRGEEVEIYVDEVKGVEASLRAYSRRLFGNKLARFVMEANADSKYPVVSMASIIAKTLRDESIKPGKLVFGDYGSGYSTDPKTIRWVKENAWLNPPLIVRLKWKNLKHLAPSWYRSPLNLLHFIRGGGEDGNKPASRG